MLRFVAALASLLTTAPAPALGPQEAAPPLSTQPTCAAAAGDAPVASLVFYDFSADPTLVNLAQDTLPLHLAMEGYDRVVLLKTPSVGPTTEAERRADRMLAPSRDNLAAQIEDLAHDGYRIDLWIFAHGYPEGVAAPGPDVRVDWLRERLSPAVTGCGELPLRMVYQMSCHGSTFNPLWLDLGARATMGARSVNFYPTQFVDFARSWNGGATFGAAARAGSRVDDLERLPIQGYLMADASQQRLDHGCTPWAAVMGAGRCAQSYFGERWGVSWRGNARATMDHASRALVLGERKLTRF